MTEIPRNASTTGQATRTAPTCNGWGSRFAAIHAPTCAGWQDLPQYLIQVCQTEGDQGPVAALRGYLEKQTVELGPSPAPEGEWPVAPLSLRLLVRLIRARDGTGAAVDLCARTQIAFGAAGTLG